MTELQAVPTFVTQSYESQTRGRRANPAAFYEPLPDSLVELLDPKTVKAHAALVGRVTKAIDAATAAAAGIDAAREADREALVAAAALGKPPPEATQPAAEAEAARAEEIASAHVEAVARSANALLAAAVPLISAALRTTEERVSAGRQRQLDLVNEAMTTGAAAAALEVEAAWLRKHGAGGAVAPYRVSAGQLGPLDLALRHALSDAEHAQEKADANRERVRREQQIYAEQVERQRAETAATRARTPRVRTRDGSIERVGE